MLKKRTFCPKRTLKNCWQLCFLVGVAFFCTSSCDTYFQPYDYDKNEEAKLKRGSYSIKFRNKELHVEKKFKLNKPKKRHVEPAPPQE